MDMSNRMAVHRPEQNFKSQTIKGLSFCWVVLNHTQHAKLHFDGISLSLETEKTRHLINAYLQLTREILPSLALSSRKDWPVREDHCFQRIVLDTICNGVWSAHLDRPAYKHLTQDQAQQAVALCHEIVDGRADLRQLNNKSLFWRGKRCAQFWNLFTSIEIACVKYLQGHYTSNVS